MGKKKSVEPSGERAVVRRRRSFLGMRIPDTSPYRIEDYRETPEQKERNDDLFLEAVVRYLDESAPLIPPAFRRGKPRRRNRE